MMRGMTIRAGEHAAMFTDEAWEAGWRAAEAAGLTTMFAPAMRPVNRRDVEEIVSAVVNHGFEEFYVEQQMPDVAIGGMHPGAMEPLRKHMRTRLAVDLMEQDCVMLTLPREVTDHPEKGITRIRLIVPVRRIGPVADRT
jgi:hypothetical protein